MNKPITIPSSSSSPKFIDGIRVTYKAASGIFNYYEWEVKNLDSLTGIIVWYWFQFDTQKWKPTKKKAVSHVSNEFWFDWMKNSPIKMRELSRDETWFTSKAIWTKTYKEWKDEWHRLTKIVYMMSNDDVSKLYKIQFSWLSFNAINKHLKSDDPNFVSTIKASDEIVTNDNGDFLVPCIVREGPLPESLYDTVVTKVVEINDILNQKDTSPVETTPVPTEEVLPWEAEEVFNDIP